MGAGSSPTISDKAILQCVHGGKVQLITEDERVKVDNSTFFRWSR